MPKVATSIRPQQAGAPACFSTFHETTVPDVAVRQPHANTPGRRSAGACLLIVVDLRAVTLDVHTVTRRRVPQKQISRINSSFMEAQGAEDHAHITDAQRRAAREARQRSQDCRNPCVYIDTEHWLKTHGRPPAPKLSTEQLAQLSESFKLIDSDGGGTVDAGELGAALQVR